MDEEEPKHSDAEPLVVLVILSTIVTISVVFEKAKETLLEKVSRNIKPIVVSLFGELTLLGFISLILFSVVKAGLADDMSVRIFGEGHENKERLQEMIELIHTALFGVMVLFLMLVVLLTRIGRAVIDRWKTLEVECRRRDKAVAALVEAEVAWRNSIWAYWKVKDAREAIAYLSFRDRFVYSPKRTIGTNVESVAVKEMDEHFDFAEYLGISLGEMLGETVEVPVAAWVSLQVVFVIMFVGMLSPKAVHLPMIVTFGYALLVFMVVLHRKLAFIQKQLLSPGLFEEASRSVKHVASINQPEEAPILRQRTVVNVHPPYLNMDLQPPSVVHCRKGRSPNQHEALFWFAPHGEHFILFSVRLLLLLIAIYVALLVTLTAMRDVTWRNTFPEISSVSATVLDILAALPALIFLPLATAIIKLYVVVSKVELMTDHHTIHKVIRYMKTQKAFRALKLLAVLKIVGSEAGHGKHKEDIIPVPVNLAHIAVPHHLQFCADVLGAASHLGWLTSKKKAGWRWGEVRNNEEKLHPDMVPFGRLGEAGRRYNISTGHSTLKLILSLGYELIGASDSDKFKAHAEVLYATEDLEELLLREGDSLKVSEEMRQLSDLIASDQHHAWARSKIETGWRYGPDYDGSRKVDPLLVPFEQLPQADREANIANALTPLEILAFLGVQVKRKHQSMERLQSTMVLTDDHREDIKKAFKLFDKENRGYIHNSDVLPALQAMGWAGSRTDAAKLVVAMDVDGSGIVTFRQFYNFVQDMEGDHEVDVEEVVRNAFARIDTDGSGSITATELYEALQEMGEDVNYDDALSILMEADRDGNGQIDIEEFAHLMKRAVASA